MRKTILCIFVTIFVYQLSFSVDLDSLVKKLNSNSVAVGEKERAIDSIKKTLFGKKDNYDLLKNTFYSCNNDEIRKYIISLRDNKGKLIYFTKDLINYVNEFEKKNSADNFKKYLKFLISKIAPDDENLSDIVKFINDPFIEDYAFVKIENDLIKKKLLENGLVSSYLKNKYILEYSSRDQDFIARVLFGMDVEDKNYDDSNILKALHKYYSNDENYFRLLSDNIDIQYKKIIVGKIKDQLSLYYFLKDKCKNKEMADVILKKIDNERYLKLIVKENFPYEYKEYALKKIGNQHIVYDYYKVLKRKNEKEKIFSLTNNVINDESYLINVMLRDKFPENRGMAAIKSYKLNENNFKEKLKEISTRDLMGDIVLAYSKLYGEDSEIVKKFKEEMNRKGKMGIYLILGGFALIVLMIFISKLFNRLRTLKCVHCNNFYNSSSSWCPVCGTVNASNYYFNVKFPKFTWISISIILLGTGIYFWQFKNSLILVLAILCYVLSGLIFLGFFAIYKDETEEEKKMCALMEKNNYLAHSDEDKRIEEFKKINSVEKLEKIKEKEKSEKAKVEIGKLLVELKMPQFRKEAIEASIRGDLKSLKSLIKLGVEVNTANNNGASLMFMAAEKNNVEIVEFLADFGADCNQTIKHGATPLFVAVQGSGNVSIVEKLLSNGANVNIKDKEGSTPLIIAASENGNLEFAKMFIKQGADVNVQNDIGATPLYFATQNCFSDFAKVLLDNKANPNLAIKQGATPLFIASQLGHLNMVNLLLKYGADKNLLFKNEIAPVDIAIENGHEEIAKILAGGDLSKLNKYAFEERKAKKYLKNLGELCKKEGIYSIWSYIDSRTNEKRFKFLLNISQSNDFEFESPKYITEKTMLYENGTMRVAGRELADGVDWNS